MTAVRDLEGRCDEEDLVKSFLPSLFDSDSEAEDLYFLQSLSSHDNSRSDYPLGQSSQGQTAESMKLTSPLSKANSTSLLHLSRQQEVSPDTGSPHSQGNSSLTVFQNSSLESCSSLDDQSPFHSMLSLTSSSSACNPETDGLEHAPVKKRKVEWSAKGYTDSVSNEPYGKGPLDPPQSPLTGFQRSMTDFHKHCGSGLGHTSFGVAACLPGGITTGVPVDSCPMAMAQLCKPLMARSASAHVATAYAPAWPGNPQPMPHQAVPSHLPSAWRSPQAMIPTASANPNYPNQSSSYGLNATPPEGSEKIAAALSEISKAPLALAPLGLKLDKAGIMQQLRGMGMRVTGK